MADIKGIADNWYARFNPDYCLAVCEIEETEGRDCHRFCNKKFGGTPACTLMPAV